MGLFYSGQDSELDNAILRDNDEQRAVAIVKAAEPLIYQRPLDELAHSYLQLAAIKKMHGLILALMEYYEKNNIGSAALDTMMPDNEAFPIAFALASLKSTQRTLEFDPEWINAQPQEALDIFEELAKEARRLNDPAISQKLPAFQIDLYKQIYQSETTRRDNRTLGVAIGFFFLMGPLCFIPALIYRFAINPESDFLIQRRENTGHSPKTGQSSQALALNGKKVGFTMDNQPTTQRHTTHYYLMTRAKAAFYDAKRPKKAAATNETPLPTNTAPVTAVIMPTPKPQQRYSGRRFSMRPRATFAPPISAAPTPSVWMDAAATAAASFTHASLPYAVPYALTRLVPAAPPSRAASIYAPPPPHQTYGTVLPPPPMYPHSHAPRHHAPAAPLGHPVGYLHGRGTSQGGVAFGSPLHAYPPSRNSGLDDRTPAVFRHDDQGHRGYQ